MGPKLRVIEGGRSPRTGTPGRPQGSISPAVAGQPIKVGSNAEAVYLTPPGSFAHHMSPTEARLLASLLIHHADRSEGMSRHPSRG